MQALSALSYKHVILTAVSYGLYKYWQSRRVRSEIEKMPVLWRGIWTSLKEKYGVNINGNFLSIARAPSTLPSAQINDLGWTMVGDGGAHVEEIIGPETFEEACEVAICHGKISMCSDESTADNIHFDSWQQFWDTSHQETEHDRPHWPGAPLRAVWIQQFDGNDSRIIAQKDETTYYLVTFGTS